MAKVQFKYNPETCRYEPFHVKGKVLKQKIFTFILISFAVALAACIWAIKNTPSLNELLLEEKSLTLKIEWDILQERLDHANQELSYLIDKDDNNYRVIVDSNPLENNIRTAGIGGSEKLNLKGLQDFPLIVEKYKRVKKLQHQLAIELQSYEEINALLDEKLIMWSSKPAIQPINNLELTQLHTTYGSRFHPILKYMREHKGLDFTADIGTPVYATGDGKVKDAYFSGSFGNVIFLDHGFNYETRYAHLSKFNVNKGQYVKRGEIIGYVGNTGLSKGPHLHYEVLFKGEHVNPINFFQRDLNNEEYEKLIEAGSINQYSLD